MKRNLQWLLCVVIVIVGCIMPVAVDKDVIDNKPKPTPEVLTGPISVLIVEQDDDRLKPGYEQYLNSMLSPTIRAYMDGHGNKINGVDWLVLDADADPQYLFEFWQDAFRKPRDSLPWIYITNNKVGYSGPLPKTEEETLNLLRKYGGL